MPGGGVNDQSLTHAYFEAQDAERAAQALDPVTWESWRARYVWTVAQDLAATGREVYRSHSLAESGYELSEPIGFEEMSSWSDGFRVVWVSRDERIILTYCEGDLSYETAPDDQAFRDVKRQHAAFYRDLLK
jgi:hypothetical protein